LGAHRTYRERKFAFGQQILTLRSRASLTQSALAEQVGVHLRSVQNWEAGESYPKAETLQRLIAVLLSFHAFTHGAEHPEAQALWSLAAADGPHALAAFNTVWFARMLALHTATPIPANHELAHARGAVPAPEALPVMPRAMIDWGEAMAVPTLYGRESEVAALHQWVVEDRCRVVALIGIGGMGKSSLAITLAQRVLSQFDVVLFRSLQNGPPLAEVLDQTIRAVSDQQATPPHQVADKIALLVQLFRERRCLLILDNLEALLQPGALAGTYRTGYADYGILLERLSQREHQSCLILTSREKPAELGPLEGRSAPVRTLHLTGLDDRACEMILKQRDIVATADDVGRLTHLYGGNPLALHLVTEPIRELFGNNVGAFLAAGDAFFNGLGKLMEQQCARTTPLEHNILYWLAIERELVPVSTLLAKLGEAVPKREVLVALESLRRRVQIEGGSNQPAFTLQPTILEFVTNQMVEVACQEIVAGQPVLLSSHALVQATAKDYLRLSQERLIATLLLERLVSAYGSVDAVERQFLTLLASWRDQPLTEQGYGPGNVINLLRLLRGHLRGLDLAHLTIRQAYLQSVAVQDTSLVESVIHDSIFTAVFDAVSAVAISSSGKYWAAASRRGEVRVLDAEGQALHRAWQAHADMVCAIAFSPDGHVLATSGSWDGTVKLWDVASGTLLWLGKHNAYANIVVFAPDGSMLASAGNDATVRLWNRQSGTPLETLLHPDPVFGVTWSPDGRLLATGDREGCIRLWVVNKTEPATCMQTLTGHTNCVEELAFAPDGHTLASASWDGTVKLWDVASGRLRQTLVGHMDRVNHVAWSPDGSTLASSSRDPMIWLWDTEQGSYRTVLHGHTAGVKGLAFTPDSHSLLSGSEDGTLRLWDVASGQCIRALQGYAASLYDVDWSPDGAHLVSGGTDTLVTVYAVAGGTPPRILRGHAGVVIGVGWSSDGRWVASSEWDNVICLWDPTSGACLQILQHPDDVENFFDRLAWSPDGQRLACGTYGRGVQVFEMTTHHKRWVGRPFPTWLRHVAWSPDGGQLVGGGADGTVYVWDAEEGRLLQQMAGHGSTLTSVAWSPDGTRLASGSSGREGGELFIWDVQRGERIYAIAGHPGMVYAVAWGASKNLVIIGGGDGLLRWWDVQSGECVRVREAHQGTVQSLRRSPDGTKVASCGDDGTIVLWDLHSGDYLQTLRRDRPYERLDITGIRGLTEAQKASLIALGAVEKLGDDAPARPAGVAHVADERQPMSGDRNVVIGLPFQPTPFIGRAAEVTEIASLLGDSACRVLTLLGPGGIGKTRLALAVAASQTAVFADGVAFVTLAAVGTSDQIVAAIGETLGLTFAGQPDSTAYLFDYLRARRMLLVLDDFDHLLDGVDLVTALLALAPRVTILVTSRERLNLQAEWLFDVQGLAYPPEDPQGSAATQSLADLNQYSAVQLFVQRATQVQPGLSLGESTFAAIVHLCQHVAGMPLAIELAAAGVRALPIATIERQIRANLDMLSTTFRDVPARHRSMRAVFNHSWRLLSEPERRLLSRLAVFRGGWTADAAAQIAEATLPALAALVDKSLVRLGNTVTRSSAVRTVPLAPRYTMLEPIREYALEQLVTRGEAATLQRAHASYYLALADAAAAHWDTPTGEQGIAQLDHERDNMRAALQWARDGGDPTLGLLLAGALRKFWRRRGAISEGRGWLEALLALDDAAPDATAIAARLRAVDAAAWIASDQHDYVRATELFEQSIALHRALGETEDATNLLVNAAIQARAVGQYGQATSLLEDTVARHRALGNRGSLSSAGMGLSLFLLGLVRRELGDFVGATACFEACVELHRAIGDHEGLAAGLLGLSDVARDQGDAVGVRQYGEESLALLRKLGVQWAIGFALNNLALAASREGDLPRALALVNESVALFRAQNAQGSLAEVLITLGRIEREQGHAAAAYATLTEALQLASAVGPRLLVAAALDELAGVVVAHGHVALATQLFAAAASLRVQMGTPVPPAEHATLEQTLTTARSTLGDDAFAAAWAGAQALPLDQLLNTIPKAAAFSISVAPHDALPSTTKRSPPA
jgi:WD40 repeat protein/predicted ATPase/DNA-binding XRE family transcriptional regulator